MKPLAACRLYTFVDSAYLRGRDPIELASELCEGGADLIQLRAKDWPVERIEGVAHELVALCARRGVWCVINDHPDIARRVGAPLAHLGQEDFFNTGHARVDGTICESRIGTMKPDGHPSPFHLPTSRGEGVRRTGEGSGSGRADPGLPLSGFGIGLSSHAPDQAHRAMAAGASYVAIGPVFATPTKPDRPPVTLELVRWAATNVVSVPWFAIGGIHLGNLEEVLAAGARRVAVVSAILNAASVVEACRGFHHRLKAM